MGSLVTDAAWPDCAKATDTHGMTRTMSLTQVAYGRVGSLVPPNRQRSRQPCSVILRPSILRLFDSPC